ncbi:MAG TPA: response regulator, partial [Candidatus Acidoferrales bacterium]|nr:response regulator [Candidatus Acidoferrales bacterium]
MAKILVADDNSNVQKTVALALADLGVEVVAVNNGEAAVKKLPDVMPDLVLADIFMPVRNGYEVCEYVKKDSRFSRIPVVLLVGAFDPLDEREAQRVGADGILKKPFVPPDPLIAMVKTLLDRTLGDRMVTAAASKSAGSKQSRSGGVALADEHTSASSVSEETREETTQPGLGRVSFGDSDRPVAFSQLLDSPTMELSATPTQLGSVADNDQILTSTRDESLGAPIFWKTENPELELKSGVSDVDADASDEIPAIGWRLGNEALNSAAASNSKAPEEPLELVRDEKDAIPSQVSTIVEPSPLRLQDAASQASLNVEASKAADLAANPLEWMASVPPPKQEEVPENVHEWSAAVPEPTDLIQAKETEPLEPAIDLAAVEIPAAHVPPVPSLEAVPATNSETTLSIPEQAISTVRDTNALSADIPTAANAQSVNDTVRSIPKQDWSDLAASIDPKAMESAQEVIKTSAAHGEHQPAEQAVAIPAPWSSAPTDSKPLASSAEDTAHSMPQHDWADLVSNLKPPSENSNSENAHSSSALVKESLASSEAQSQTTSPASVAPVSKPSNASLENTDHSLPKLDWADLAASLQTRPSESATPTLAGTSAASPVNGQAVSIPPMTTSPEVPANQEDNGISVSPADPDPALVEAVVQRVLDKMR